MNTDSKEENTPAYVYKECYGADLETLTQQGWELMLPQVSHGETDLRAMERMIMRPWAHRTMYLLRRPFKKPTSMQAAEQLEESKKALEILVKDNQENVRKIARLKERIEFVNKVSREAFDNVPPTQNIKTKDQAIDAMTKVRNELYRIQNETRT